MLISKPVSFYFSGIGRGIPARDLEFTTHLCRISWIDHDVDAFKHDERFRLLDIIKKMNELRPRTLRFDGGKNRLVTGVRLAVTDRWILNQNVVFARNLLELIKQGRGITCPTISRLMLAYPLLALRPNIALAHVNH